MRRTQIQLDESTYEALRRLAFARRQSLSATIRELLRQVVAPKPRRRLRIEDFTFIGAARSGRGKERISERHDEVLGEGRW